MVFGLHSWRLLFVSSSLFLVGSLGATVIGMYTCAIILSKSGPLYLLVFNSLIWSILSNRSPYWYSFEFPCVCFFGKITRTCLKALEVDPYRYVLGLLSYLLNEIICFC